MTHFRALYIALAKSTPSAPRIAQLVEHLTVVVTIGYQIVIGSIPISGTFFFGLDLRGDDITINNFGDDNVIRISFLSRRAHSSRRDDLETTQQQQDDPHPHHRTRPVDAKWGP